MFSLWRRVLFSLSSGPKTTEVHSKSSANSGYLNLEPGNSEPWTVIGILFSIRSIIVFDNTPLAFFFFHIKWPMTSNVPVLVPAFQYCYVFAKSNLNICEHRLDAEFFSRRLCILFFRQKRPVVAAGVQPFEYFGIIIKKCHVCFKILIFPGFNHFVENIENFFFPGRAWLVISQSSYRARKQQPGHNHKSNYGYNTFFHSVSLSRFVKCLEVLWWLLKHCVAYY